MDQLTRPTTLITVGRLRWIQPRALAQPDTLQDSRDRRERHPQSCRDLRGVIRSRLSRTISWTRSGGVLCGIRFGAEERSSNPSAPSARQRAIQRRAVRSVIPAASAASITDQPPSMRSTSSCLLFGQVRALACNFIRCPPWDWWLRHQSASKEARMTKPGRTYLGTTASPGGVPSQADGAAGRGTG